MPVGTRVGLEPGHSVLHVDPAQPPHNFRPMSVVAKRLEGSSMPLGTEINLGPGHIVLDGA